MSPPGKVVAVAIGMAVLLGALGPTVVVLPTTAAVGNTGPTSISACTSITSPGTYVLSADISTSIADGDECLEIRSSDVILDGSGQTITNTGAGTAINVTSAGSITNVTVANVAVQNGGTGIRVQAPGASTDVDVSVIDNDVTAAAEGLLFVVDGPQSNVHLDIGGNRLENVTNYGIDINASGNNTTATVPIVENTIISEDDGVDDILADGGNQTLDLTFLRNTVRATSQGIDDIDIDDDGSTATVIIHDNQFVTSDEGIDDIDGSGDGNELRASLVNNTIESGSYAIDYIEAYDQNQTVDVDVVDNTISASYEGIYSIYAAGDSSIVDVNVDGNEITSSDDEGIDEIDADAHNVTARVTVTDNTITAKDEPIYQIDTTGENTTAEIRVIGNTLTSQDNSGIEDLWIADSDNIVGTLVFAHNEVVSGSDDTIDDIDAYGDNTKVDIQLVNNSFTAKSDHVFDSIDADDINQTVNLTIAHNDVVSNDDGFQDMYLDGENSTINLAIVGNNIDTNATAISGITVNGDNSTVDVTIAKNILDGEVSGIDDFDVDGSNQTVTGRILGNRITGFSTYGIAFDDAAIIGADRFDVNVVGNTIQGSGLEAVGFRVDPVPGSGIATTLVAEHNIIEAATDAVEVDTGPVTGMQFRRNVLGGSGFGVASANTTVGAYVDAVGNFWTAADGPGSEGPYEDPVTGTLANGAGSHVTNSNATLTNVHFDPFLESEPAPHFTVDVESTNSPRIEGQAMTVNATVENHDAGAQRTSHTLELVVNGTVRDEVTVSPIPGVPTPASLSWQTTSGDAGDYSATVRSADDSDAIDVTVTEFGGVEGSIQIASDSQQDGTTDGDQDGEEQEGDQEQEQEDQGEGGETITAVQTTQQDGQTQVQATVQDAQGGEPVEVQVSSDADADVDTDAAPAQLTSVSVTPAADATFSLEITESPEPLDSSPEFNLGDGTTPVSYLSVQHTLPNADIQEATITYRVSESSLEAMDSSPEDVSMYRHDGEGWVEQPTQVVGRDDGAAILQATADGLSEWTAAAKRPRLNVTDTQVSVQAATTEEQVTIQVFVTNTGGTDGVYEAELLLNEETVDQTERTVPDGGTVAVNFERTFAQPGLYEIQVNDVFVGEVNISAADQSVDVETAEGVQIQAANASDEQADGSGGGSLPTLPLGILFVAVAGLGIWFYLSRGGE